MLGFKSGRTLQEWRTKGRIKADYESRPVRYTLASLERIRDRIVGGDLKQ